MFKVLPGKGFAITFENGTLVEIDFGPLSQSENKNISKEAFKATGGQSGTAEFRVYRKGDSSPSAVHDNVTAEQAIKLAAVYGHIDVPPLER